MSLIDNLRGKPAVKAPTKEPTYAYVASVTKKLETAEADLQQLEQQYGQAALDAMLSDGDTGAITRKLADAKSHVETIRAAHKAALERQQLENQQARAQLAKTQLNYVKKKLASRDAAAAALQLAIVEAAKQFHLLLDESAAARRACPHGFSWPPGDMCNQDELIQAFANCLYRESSTANNPHDGRAFPTPAADHSMRVHNPRAIAELDKRVAEASANVIGVLTGKVLGTKASS